MKKNKVDITGFTLIELLVVVLIIGILLAVTLPQYQLSVDKARYAAMMAAINAVKQSEELYYLTNGTYTNSFDELYADLPGECTRTFAIYECGSFSLRLESSNVYVYGRLTDVPRNSYILYYDHTGKGKRECYAYPSDGSRGEKLCASFSKKSPTDGCAGSCKVYSLD